MTSINCLALIFNFFRKLDYAKWVAIWIFQNDIVCILLVIPRFSSGSQTKQALHFAGLVCGVKIHMMAAGVGAGDTIE